VSADADAIVIGAGHNGLVAAKRLAERGWNVLVLEAAAEPGGAVRSGELCEPGFTGDLFSSFHPLAAASPAIRSLELERFGLRWRRSPLALAHPQPGGACAVVSTDLAETAASLERFAPGDGDAWRELHGYWERAGGPFMEALLRPFPPLRAGARRRRRQRGRRRAGPGPAGAGGPRAAPLVAPLPVRNSSMLKRDSIHWTSNSGRRSDGAGRGP
jgi:phytoene dehydrogenase-like protein